MPRSVLVAMSICTRCGARGFRDDANDDLLPDGFAAVSIEVEPADHFEEYPLCPICSDALRDWLAPDAEPLDLTRPLGEQFVRDFADETAPEPPAPVKPATADRDEVKAQLQTAITEALAVGVTMDQLHALTPDTGSPKTWKHATPKLEEMLAAVRALVETMRQPADDVPTAPADDAPEPVEVDYDAIRRRIALYDQRLTVAESVAVREAAGVGVSTKPGDVALSAGTLAAWCAALEHHPTILGEEIPF